MGTLVKEISNYLDVKEEIIFTRLKKHNRFYRRAYIDKKSGGKREIFLPSKELKAIQYFILEKYLSKITLTEYAYAYRKGISIINNIVSHAGNRHFLKIDLKDFFESLDYKKAQKVLQKELHGKLNNVEIEELLQFCTYKNHFVQGAVTSPVISNILFKELDEKIISLVSSLANVKYTRYSDDIVISSSEKISERYLKDINDLLNENNYAINFKKTYFTSNCNGVRITGLNLVNYTDIKVGTKYKKELKNMIYHKLKYKEKSVQSCEVIIGKLMFLKCVEPEYYNFLNITIRKT